MLQHSTIDPHALDILKKIMRIPELNDFYLVGGTALALNFGHRLSVDLDLFSTNKFENEKIAQLLSNNFPGFAYRNTNNPIGLFGFIDDVKVDFVQHHYHSLIETIIENDGIRMFSIADLMAMKIAAIMKRGVKKDFWDIAELLKYYSVEDFIKFYTQKYPTQQLLVSVPFVLTYFIDAEESEEPVSLKGQTWPGVKKFIQQKVNDYLK